MNKETQQTYWVIVGKIRLDSFILYFLQGRFTIKHTVYIVIQDKHQRHAFTRHWKEIYNQTYSIHSNTRQTLKTCIHKTLEGDLQSNIHYT